MGEFETLEGAFGKLLDSAPDAMVVTDQDGRIVLVNGMVEHLFGYKREELVGEPVETLIPERFRGGHKGHRQGYYDAPHVRMMGAGLELYARRKDGSEFPVEISLSPIETEQGRLVTSAIRDITDRRAIEKRLEQHARELARSNADLEQFAYVASHDLQEPLRVVASFAQLLARRYEGQLGDDADEFIAYIVDGATRMQDLINDLLAYSRVSSRSQEFESTDLNEVVKRAITNARFSIEEAGGEVTSDPLPTIHADADQLLQLFQNLIANAIKFRREGTSPQVHIGVEDGPEAVTVSVQDNGIGIDPQYSERIFTLFQRLHGKDKFKGTGIGLAICKKIVERHGGRIWVESQPGEGSKFILTLSKHPEGDTQEWNPVTNS